MLKINLETNINNLNYNMYMEHSNNEDGENKGNMESERATIEENHKEKNIFS